ncbi:hypothetical protein F2P56_031708 [Juglans regia]|uniref:Protein kinase domain-containing protein n=2 Tax=Juglans regia TaxID=51240 RepID=A0A833TAT0_JUGRE|nr:probable serine/threonine-protein kinase PBL7 [Juglans regia]KAF5446045.1 hypothetical protein F2P56_031708 [Juglans regia]
MSTEVQRVVVIQDASKDVSLTALRWALKGLSLKPGDVMTLVGVLHQVNNPLGFKTKVDETNQIIVQKLVAGKNDEYHNNVEIKKISEEYEAQKIEFYIDVHAGPCPKVVAVKAARKLRATWVILDRQMKQEKKYFMEKLSCGISRMKRDNSVQLLRGAKAMGVGDSTPSNTESISAGAVHVPYNEMVQGSTDEELSPNRFPGDNQKNSLDKGHCPDGCQPQVHRSEASSSSCTEAKCSPLHFKEEGNTTTTEQRTGGERSLQSISANRESGPKETSNLGSPDEQKNNKSGWTEECLMEEEFPNSVCSICENRRPKIGWKREFTYSELHAATKGFSIKNFLSEGGFGCVYRGVMDGLKIAVKQHKNASLQGEKEFKSEVRVLSKVRHKNLVRLLGSCSEGSHRLLVYEYICHGSLDLHLSRDSRKPISWDKRMKIAMGVAQGLQYLHENKVIHRDMRPNNILITHDYEALLGDFGLARTQHEDPNNSLETMVVGTLGYLAPEYAECGKASTKTDVYAFGVVLLQLITGMRTTDRRLGGKSLVGWARPLLKEKNYPALIDERIMDSHDVHQLFWMVRVAEKCLSKDPDTRLTMENVVGALDYIIECNPICGKVCSPARSDSFSSMPVTPDSQGSMRDSPESHAEDGSIVMASASTIRLSSMPEKFTWGGENIDENETEVPPTNRVLLYDEMMVA